MSFFLKELQSVYETVYESTDKMKRYTKPKIYHGGKNFDVDKRWYIYYNYVNPETGEMERQTPISLYLNKRYKDAKERLLWFKKLRDVVEKQLKKGHSPYDKGDENTNNQLLHRWYFRFCFRTQKKHSQRNYLQRLF